MERFVNDNAEHIRKSEEGTRKIGHIVKETVLNASTTDGVSPAESMTQFAKDILSSTGDAAVHLLKILFRKHKVRVQPTPKLINALKKGSFAYDNGLPDNLSITQLPATLQGTELKEVDIARLLSLEASKAITETQTESLNKSILPISRTLYYLLDKAHAWAVIMEAMFGPNSFIAIEASSWHNLFTENFGDLQEICTVWDNNLAPKIEISISEILNRAFRSSMIGVPDESIFNNKLREEIFDRTAHLELPTAVKAVLDRPKNAKRGNEPPTTNTGGNSKRQRNSGVRVNHNNQPIILKLTPDQYRANVGPFIQANKDKLPKYDVNTDECMKFAFLGYCNGDCPRKAAHVKSENLQRNQTLRGPQQTQTRNPQKQTQQQPLLGFSTRGGKLRRDPPPQHPTTAQPNKNHPPEQTTTLHPLTIPGSPAKPPPHPPPRPTLLITKRRNIKLGAIFPHRPSHLQLHTTNPHTK
jgi:ferredoxin